MDEARRKEVERALEHDLAHPSGLWPWNAYCRELLAALSAAETRAEKAFLAEGYAVTALETTRENLEAAEARAEEAEAVSTEGAVMMADHLRKCQEKLAAAEAHIGRLRKALEEAEDLIGILYDLESTLTRRSVPLMLQTHPEQGHGGGADTADLLEADLEKLRKRGKYWAEIGKALLSIPVQSAERLRALEKVAEAARIGLSRVTFLRDRAELQSNLAIDVLEKALSDLDASE